MFLLVGPDRVALAWHFATAEGGISGFVGFNRGADFVSLERVSDAGVMRVGGEWSKVKEK